MASRKRASAKSGIQWQNDRGGMDIYDVKGAMGKWEFGQFLLEYSSEKNKELLFRMLEIVRRNLKYNLMFRIICVLIIGKSQIICKSKKQI